MKIAYIAAGAAGMYCGSCLQDNTLAVALKNLGHDVTLIPTYTPMKTDDRDVSTGRIFYGAINIYLQQKAAIFRHLPRILDRFLNRPRLLDLAIRLGTSTDPRDLGPLTLSVLQGEDGRQTRELEILIDWLREEHRPDVVHLTNSMFLGLTRPLKRELDVPVLCSLQGEDLFVEGLNPPYRDQVLAALRERARDADGFVTTCNAYSRFMSEWLQAPPEKMHVVPLGLNLQGHEVVEPPADGPFVIGYLARIAPEKGLHLLAEAFRDLAARHGPDKLRLRVAGYVGPRDRAYLSGVRSRLRDWGLADSCDFLGEVDRQGKLGFLESLHVLSVPTVYRDPKGRFVLEALASGVPVVQPRHGAFPEIIAETEGGLLVEPESATALADGLQALMDDPEQRRELGHRGRDAVYNGRGARAMAEATLEVYRSVTGADDGE
jgi:glycosyltransferase involved in cell wall biosynthesis